MSLEIDVSEDKRQSGWQCQEGKCNREKKSLGKCFFFARDGIEKPEAGMWKRLFSNRFRFHLHRFRFRFHRFRFHHFFQNLS